MHYSRVILSVIALIGFTCSTALSETPKWVDPLIVRKLQAIQSIDRSKYKFDVAALATHASATMRDVQVIEASSIDVLPELPNLSPQTVLVISGKTKQAVTLDGKRYPAGLATSITYGADGNPISTMIARPLTYVDFKPQ